MSYGSKIEGFPKKLGFMSKKVFKGSTGFEPRFIAKFVA